MLPQQPTTFTIPNRIPSLIDRVLHLRQQLGIDIPLSVRDSEELREPQVSSIETLRPADNRRDWLVWSQSPGEGNMQEKQF